jgi:hypothetical protein
MSATISEFSDGFLVAAHLLQLENPGRMLKAGEILEFSAGRRAGRTKQAVDKLYDAGLIFTSDAGDDGYGPIVEEDLSLRLTDQGHMTAEQLQKDEQHRIVQSVLRTWDSFQNKKSTVSPIQVVESVNWTGLAQSASPEYLIKIKEKANDLRVIIVQSDIDMQTRNNALKRVDAVVSLLEAPDIPWKEVVEILNSPFLSAFLAVTSLIQLISGMAS